MPFVPATNVVQVTIDQSYGSQPLANVINVQSAIAVTEVALVDIADTVMTWLSGDYAPLCHLGWQTTRLRLRDLTTATSLVYEQSVSGLVGALAGTPLPSSIAMCLSFRSTLAGRSRRGRFYSSGLTAAHLEGANQNHFTAAAITARVTALNALRTALSGAGFPLVIVSKFLAGAPRVSAVVTPVTSVLSTDVTVDSQRGRTRS